MDHQTAYTLMRHLRGYDLDACVCATEEDGVCAVQVTIKYEDDARRLANALSPK